MPARQLTYGSYLKVPELLSLQQRESHPAHHDEMLFIIVHQVHELWFKQLLHELDAVRGMLLAGKALPAIKAFKRVHSIMGVMLKQIDVLETMTPQEFNAFRSLLRPASGFQSTQFRELEFLSGGGDPAVLQHMFADPGLVHVERRRGEPTLYDALLTLLSTRGFAIPAHLLAPGGTRQPREDDPAVVEAFRRVYESHDTPAEFELYLLFEAFIEYDSLVLQWRSRHVRMVERTIGMKKGTGGSEGAGYLHRTLAGKFFPELWTVRTVLGQ
jgi:tryptophan 2,3-dioxygenase